MNLKYYVGGVNGVGKTMLLKAIADARPNFRVIKGSEELMKWLGIPGDYDALRAMSQDDKNEAWEKCLTHLLETEREHDILVDAHYLNLVNGEVIEAADEGVVKGFDALVLLTAPVAEILRRIDNDPSRDRALFKFDEADRYQVMDEYQEKTRSAFYDLAGYNRGLLLMPELIIEHLDNQTPRAVEEFLAFDAKVRTTVAEYLEFERKDSQPTTHS